MTVKGEIANAKPTSFSGDIESKHGNLIAQDVQLHGDAKIPKVVTIDASVFRSATAAAGVKLVTLPANSQILDVSLVIGTNGGGTLDIGSENDLDGLVNNLSCTVGINRASGTQAVETAWANVNTLSGETAGESVDLWAHKATAAASMTGYLSIQYAV